MSYALDLPSRRLQNPALRLGFAAALILLLGACAGAGPRPPLPVSEVVAMSKSGTAPELVIQKLSSVLSNPKAYSIMGKKSRIP